MPRLTPSQQLEKRLKDRLVKAMATYQLISDDDRIMVGLSGGKDSLCLLELLAQRQRIAHPRFKIAALHVRMDNIEYESDTSYLESFCHENGVELYVRTTHFDTIPGDRRTPCFLCSWYRRKVMFNLAQELGFNKIALGHHQDDIIHTALMSTFFQGQFATMPARIRMRKMPLTIIRPLCLISEADIQLFATERGYLPQKKRCPYESDTHRTDVRHLFAEIESLNPESRSCIWRALENAGKLVEE
jgi:tRNA(Ile)-lysidine synthase TilS/MesJ